MKLYKQRAVGAPMSDYAITKDWPDTITFDRLHALAQRGYRACLGSEPDDSGFSRIDLWHPKVTGQSLPPRLTIWSNGIVATRELLWPLRHVPCEDGSTPDWQKFIDVSDDRLFRDFVESVPKPNVVDLYVHPFGKHFKTFCARLLFGATLCASIAFAVELLGTLVR